MFDGIFNYYLIRNINAELIRNTMLSLELKLFEIGRQLANLLLRSRA